MVTPLPTTGDLVRLKRLQAGLSARALSVRSGQSGSYVSKLEAGTIEPSLRGFARLAKALEMTPQEIYTVVLCEAAGEKEEEDE